MELTYFNNLKVNIFIPEKDNFDTIVYFHGGGIESGSKDDPWCLKFCEHLAKAGFCVFSFNYSLYPNTKFPQYLNEAAQAVKFAFNKVKEFNGNGKIYVSGQSAGAYIAMMLCCNGNYLKSVGLSPLDIAGWLSDAGQMTDHFNVIKYETKEDCWLQRISEFSPLYFVKPNFKTSPILLIAYENDMFCRIEQNILLKNSISLYDKNAKIDFVILPGSHCAGSTTLDSDGEFAVIKEIKKFISKK